MAGTSGNADTVNAALTAVAKRRNAHPSKGIGVFEKLESIPGSFAFAQAMDLIERRLREDNVIAPDKAIRFRVNPDLSFPPGDIKTVCFKKAKNGKTSAEVTLNLLGLHGSASPLPTYFTEYIAKHYDEDSTLRDFFDIFNDRLIAMLYGIWRKYRYYMRYECGATDQLSQYLMGFMGMGHKVLREAKGLDWARLLAYVGLIAFKGDASGSLESTLRHYFRHPNVVIEPCIVRRVQIPQDQQNRLGLANSRLSEDCLLGTSVQDQSGKFRVSIRELGWERFNSFLPYTNIFRELKDLARFVLLSRLQFEVELRLKPEEIRPLRIGKDSVNRLGWSTWLGDNGDGVVVLQVAYKEL